MGIIEQLLGLLDEEQRTYLIMILLDTIQLCFSKENYQVRMLSISIFHKIISNIPVNIEIEENQYQLNEFITKHIHFNLMRLFLHSNDENNAVKNICLNISQFYHFEV